MVIICVVTPIGSSDCSSMTKKNLLELSLSKTRNFVGCAHSSGLTRKLTGSKLSGVWTTCRTVLISAKRYHRIRC